MEAKRAEYPAHLARQRRLADGRTVVIRPVRPEDEPAEREFLPRFTGAVTDTRFYTRIDYDRHMAFVCEHDGRLVGEARYVANPSSRSCEFGIVVADEWHHTGVAQLLAVALTRAAHARGFETMEGLVLGENTDMLDFVKELDFEISPMPEEPALARVVKKL